MARDIKNFLLTMGILEGASAASLILTDSTDGAEVVHRDDIPFDNAIPVRDALGEAGVSIDTVGDDLVDDFADRVSASYLRKLESFTPKLRVQVNETGTYDVWVEMDGKEFARQAVSGAVAKAIISGLDDDCFLSEEEIRPSPDNSEITVDNAKTVAIVEEIKRAIVSDKIPVTLETPVTVLTGK